MSVRVDPAALHAEINRFGPRALLVTSSTDGPPRVSSVFVTFEGGDLRMGAGRTIRGKAALTPAVSIVWSTDTEPEYCLIVDGTLRAGPGESLLVSPTGAVLHRLATAPSTIEP